MLSSLQKEKLTHFFNILDYDKNGFIQEDDFDAIAENLWVIRDADYDSDGHDEFASMTKDIWSSLVVAVGRDEANLEQWLWYMDELLLPDNTEKYKSYLMKFVTTLFRVFDIDSDGNISESEYIDWFIGLRIEVRFAPRAFKNLDLNKDGLISFKELLKCVDEFMRSKDPNSHGNWLFGSWEK